jgi:hypothetical protein
VSIGQGDRNGRARHISVATRMTHMLNGGVSGGAPYGGAPRAGAAGRRAHALFLHAVHTASQPPAGPQPLATDKGRRGPPGTKLTDTPLGRGELASRVPPPS